MRTKSDDGQIAVNLEPDVQEHEQDISNAQSVEEPGPEPCSSWQSRYSKAMATPIGTIFNLFSMSSYECAFATAITEKLTVKNQLRQVQSQTREG